MAEQVLVHILNEDPFVADMEAQPAENATHVIVRNPRTKEGRQVPWAQGPSKSFLIPMARVTYIEFMITESDKKKIEGFFRESTKGY